MELIQGTQEWLEWRKKGIGGSDVPILMEESDFSTPYQLWEDKLGMSKPVETNWAMQRGTDAEPKIRALYELKYGYEVPPALIIHPEHSWGRVSLDGWNAQRGLVAELKYPSEEKHALAVKGEVPRCYIGQLQYQLWVTGGKVAHYVSYNGHDIAVVEVTPDPDYQSRMLPVLKAFWKCVETKTAPKLTSRDYLAVETEKARAVVQELKRLKVILEEAKAAYEAAEEKAIQECSVHPRTVCEGIKFIQVERKGAIPYAKIPALKGVDLEQYRTAPTTYWKVDFGKKSSSEQA